MRDINHQPVGMYRITDNRTLYQNGMLTLHYYLFTLVIAGALILALLWFLLKFYVLDRLLSVSHQVVNLTTKNRFSERIVVSGKDELAHMVGALNSLLELIELTQEKLFMQISQRTGKLEKISQLNKNLFDEINKQEVLKRRCARMKSACTRWHFTMPSQGCQTAFSLMNSSRKRLSNHKKLGLVLLFVFMDANNFKQVNDQYGHAVGDNFLRYIAQQLKTVIKDSDVAARFSGDEFIIFLATSRIVSSST